MLTDLHKAILRHYVAVQELIGMGYLEWNGDSIVPTKKGGDEVFKLSDERFEKISAMIREEKKRADE